MAFLCLGIGGGPINVAFLTLMFSFTMRDAVTNFIEEVVTGISKCFRHINKTM